MDEEEEEEETDEGHDVRYFSLFLPFVLRHFATGHQTETRSQSARPLLTHMVQQLIALFAASNWKSL